MAKLHFPSLRSRQYLTGGGFSLIRRQRDRQAPRYKASLPPARQNGLVAGNSHFTEYKQVGHHVQAVSPDARHATRPSHQSLPNSSSNKLTEENYRQTNSAPQRARQRRHDAPRHLPKINNLVRSQKVEPLQAMPPAPFNNYRTGPTAGRSTKDGDVKNLRSSRFATSWADARAGRITSDPSPSRDESPRAREVPTGTPSRSPASRSPKMMGANATLTNGKSPSTVRSPDKDGKSPSVDAIGRDAQARRVNQKKVVHGKPKIDSKTIKPMRKQTTTHMEVQNGDLKRKKTMYLEKPDQQQQVAADEQEKLQKSVYGVSQVSRIYNSKTSLSRRDLDSRAHLNPSQMERATETSYYYHPNETKSLPPWRRGEYTLTKNETKTYKSIKKVYDNKVFKKQRQDRFLKRLGEMQNDEVKRYNENAKDAMLRRIQTKIQQQMQLQRVRERFEEDQARRFRTQYVTIRNLRHEYEDRQVYGLPEDLNKGTEYRAKLKRKKPIKTYEVYGDDEVREKNKRRYGNLFSVKKGPQLVDQNAKPPRMEGIDTVDLSEPNEADAAPKAGAKDKRKHKKTDVKDVLNDAKRVLEQQKDEDSRSPKKANRGKPSTTAASKDKDKSVLPVKTPSPVPNKEELQKLDNDLESLDLDADDDDDDDDDDIFEKARRKYNINLDSDEDD